ncbi:protein-L-isoaspartate(D-aspartate) O-methyltransferase [Streptacidiphilus pinicola]|uniref:Protein-L-isoaspartate O-methyltransferase n=1 Tax=Streptacidiphilus pinicola TaxID=2219663 RepID=A0A2X0K137_9ACTN|nr:ATP-grasp peptide maturase system methyltransferase [Streptacidiphilus pinicola]RAG81229.1 protein-L-isoaspartate(D-aspartate) O-methyltransferase [Streptacidiphilus pinicola]
MTDASLALRAELIDRLTASGVVRDPAWEQAARAVPREAFLRDGYFSAIHQPGAPTQYQPVQPGDAAWLPGAYRDESLVTQLDGNTTAAGTSGPIQGAPTSSSTLPSLVLRMLEDLHVEEDMRVLEIGTGTGYSTALLSERLGDGNVVSIEVDKRVSIRAGNALTSLGYHPELVVGDGLLGHKESEPYDRVIATCQVTDVPQNWIDQTKPGGIILATVGGWLHSSELARLTVISEREARGHLLTGNVSFMLARPQSPPPFGLLPDLDAGDERTTPIGADLLGDWTARFVMQLAAPAIQRLDLPRHGRTEHVLLDVETGAWAAAYIARERWVVRQGGPYEVWDRIEEQIARWQASGSPDLSAFQISVMDGVQSVTWSE